MQSFGRARLRAVSVMAWCVFAAMSPAQTCVPEYAQNVVGHQLGNYSANSPSDVLGDTPNTWFAPGSGGWVTVDFGAAITTSGDGAPDLFVEEWGQTDCYYICLVPSDAATQTAFQNAGLNDMGNNLWQIPTSFCATQSIDLDQYVPGFNCGDLGISEVMVEDDWGGNGIEISRIRAEKLCTGNPPPPPPSGNCVPQWVHGVVSHYNGNNQTGTSPNNVVGNTSASHNTGSCGWITVEFGDTFTTTGDSGFDLCVFESGNDECYYLCLRPADSATAAALQAAGLQHMGNNLWQVPQTFCGNEDIDLDAIIPGFSEGGLLFAELMIEDDCSGGNGIELRKIEAKRVCTPPTPLCVPEYATTVVNAVPGGNQIASYSDPTDALGQTPATQYSLGDSGCLALGFGNVFTTSGDNGDDVTVFEWNSNDCWHLGVKPANAATAAALTNAGLSVGGDGYYDLGQTFCGSTGIDIDAIIPGANEGDLLFLDLQVKDDGAPGGTDNGAEIHGVRVELRCNLAKVGNRIFADVNCDGIQTPGELGVENVQVTIYDDNGNPVDTTTTDFTGAYCFYVAPGTYEIGVAADPAKFTVTVKGQGNDPAMDSDIDPVTGKSDPVTVVGGETRDDIDAGLCLVCVGPPAFVVNGLPACTNSPNDPILTASMPLIGQTANISIDASNFPNSQVIIFVTGGPPQPFQVPLPNTVCTIYVDFMNLIPLAGGHTDGNGQFSVDLPIPAEPLFSGMELTIQARICDPTQPGPIPGFPDWLSSASHIRLGCF